MAAPDDVDVRGRPVQFTSVVPSAPSGVATARWVLALRLGAAAAVLVAVVGAGTVLVRVALDLEAPQGGAAALWFPTPPSVAQLGAAPVPAVGAPIVPVTSTPPALPALPAPRPVAAPPGGRGDDVLATPSRSGTSGRGGDDEGRSSGSGSGRSGSSDDGGGSGRRGGGSGSGGSGSDDGGSGSGGSSSGGSGGGSSGRGGGSDDG